MKNELNEKKYGAISLLPLIVFLALYIGSGISKTCSIISWNYCCPTYE